MRVGIDTYSFHRMLGFCRAFEQPSAHALSDGGAPAIELAVRLGVDVVAFQTCFLAPVGEIDSTALTRAAAGRELVVSWGAPDGLAYGTMPDALTDAHRWIDVAAELGSRVMRIVLGGPRLRGLEPMDVRRTRVVPQLAELADHAGRLRLRLAIENHGEITSVDLRSIIDAIDHPALGVCFDTANAIRVGDDAVAAARLLCDRTWMVHLKDIEPLELVTDPVSGPRSRPYGEGIVPVDEILDVLAEPIAAGAPVCVELGQIADGTDELVMITDSITWLRQRSS